MAPYNYIFGDGKPSNELLINKYIPIKRQIRYDGTAGSTHNGDLRFVFWYSSYQSDGTTNQITVIQENVQLFTYFRDPEV